jgi:hypothetical protein
MLVSIADYIGMDIQAHDYGRSMFRHYDTPRPIYGGSMYQQTSWVLNNNTELLMCKSYAMRYNKFRIPENDLFGDHYTPTAANPVEKRFFRRSIESINNHLPSKTN